MIGSLPTMATFEEMVPMPDGIRLYTYGIRPVNGIKCPTIIHRNPYKPEERIDRNAFLESHREKLARGYAYVEQHCRGTGMSEGDWIPYESERADGLALLDWVRSRPWFNGEIFLEGGSYSSSVHWAYLDTNPPDVKGAALSVQDVNRYSIIYRNGFFKIGLAGNWLVRHYKQKNHDLMRNEAVRLTDFPLCDFSRRYWGASEPSLDLPLVHPRRDDPFWQSDAPGSGVCYRRALLDSTMPVLLKTGFYDIYTDGVCEMWRELPPKRRANCALLIDAYDHGGSVADDMKGTCGEFPGGGRADEGVSPIDWFDYCRTGKPCDNAEPGMTRYYALWENRWLDAEELTDGPRRIDIPLGKGDRSWAYNPLLPLPDFPGSGGICFGGMRPQPPPNFRDDMASFILPPVEETIDVRGRMRASLLVKSDCEDTCFYVRVSVKKPDGKWYLLRDDITSLSANGADYEPGMMRRVEFCFADHAFRLERGDQLRVDVASACSQFAPHGNVKGLQSALREPKLAHNTVFGESSSLVLFADLKLNADVENAKADDGTATDWKPSARWRGVNLLGMFRCPTTGLKPDPRVDGHFVEWEFEALREWGFNFARLPLDYRILTTGDSWTNLDERKLQLLDQAIAWGRQYGIHVQVALHRIPGYCILDETEAFPLGTSPIAQEAACAMWGALAKRWKGIPNEELSFNLFNEPYRHTAGENYLPLCLKLIDAIRKEDLSRFIIADGNACASQPVPELYGIPSVGQAFRGYTPHAVTHYGADFIGGIPKTPPTWPLAPEYASVWQMEMPEATVAKYQGAIDAGEFCMVGEFGCRATTPHEVVLAWMEHCLKLWKSKNLGWAIWNLRGIFGFIDSDRADVAYEDYRGHKLDRKMLELLREY